MLFYYRVVLILMFFLFLAGAIFQFRDPRPIRLGLIPTDPDSARQVITVETFGDVAVVTRKELQFPQLTALQKIFAPGQPGGVGGNYAFDLLTSGVICLGILFIIFMLFRIDPARPFLPEIAHVISYISYIVFSLGILDTFRNKYFDKLIQETSHGIYKLDRANHLIPILLIFGVINWLARSIRKAAELQNENDLTI